MLNNMLLRIILTIHILSKNNKGVIFMMISEKWQKAVDEVSQVKIIDYAKMLGFTIVPKGRYYSLKEHDSVRIDDKENYFWRNSNRVNGGIIVFVEHFTGYDFKESVKLLQQYLGIYPTETNYNIRPKKSIQYQQKEQFSKSKEFILPQANSDCKRAFGYLVKERQIDYEIVAELVKKKYIYQDIRGNVVFAGFDNNNIAKYASLRGTATGSKFRGDVTGSDKKYSFSLSNGTDIEKLYVFEAPIDLLSHATIANIAYKNNNTWKIHNRLALSGTSDVALKHYLSEHKNIKVLHLCLDNDEAGKNATQQIAEKYHNLGYSIKIHTPKFKDFNEDLKFIYRQQTVTQTKPSPIRQTK